MFNNMSHFRKNILLPNIFKYQEPINVLINLSLILIVNIYAILYAALAYFRSC